MTYITYIGVDAYVYIYILIYVHVYLYIYGTQMYTKKADRCYRQFLKIKSYYLKIR